MTTCARTSEQLDLYQRGIATLIGSWEAYARCAAGGSVRSSGGFTAAIFPCGPERDVYNNAVLARDLEAGALQQPRNALTQQDVIVGKHHPPCCSVSAGGELARQALERGPGDVDSHALEVAAAQAALLVVERHPQDLAGGRADEEGVVVRAPHRSRH